MNVFDAAIASGRIATEADLKRAYRRLAKRTHPDLVLNEADTVDAAIDPDAVVAAERNQRRHADFIRLNADYEAALARLEASPASAAPRRAAPKAAAAPVSFHDCAQLFADLMAGNFPASKRVIHTNKTYAERIIRLNDDLASFGPAFADLFKDVENELYELRGRVTPTNHEFYVVKIYLNNLGCFIIDGQYFAAQYLKASHDLVWNILRAHKAERTLFFLDWLLWGIGVKLDR